MSGGMLTLLDLIKATPSLLVLLSTLQVRLPLSIKKFPGTLAMKCPV